MIKRARKDWENLDDRVDEGNWYEFLPLSYRFKHWDGWHNLRLAIKRRSLLELRMYRTRVWYPYIRPAKRLVRKLLRFNLGA